MKTEKYTDIQTLDYLGVENAIKDLIFDNFFKISNYDFKGKNFMTPDVISKIIVGKNNVEISYGSGFSNKWIIGVTCSNHREELSGAVHSLEELQEKLNEIKDY